MARHLRHLPRGQIGEIGRVASPDFISSRAILVGQVEFAPPVMKRSSSISSADPRSAARVEIVHRLNSPIDSNYSP